MRCHGDGENDAVVTIYTHLGMGWVREIYALYSGNTIGSKHKGRTSHMPLSVLLHVLPRAALGSCNTMAWVRKFSTKLKVFLGP